MDGAGGLRQEQQQQRAANSQPGGGGSAGRQEATLPPRGHRMQRWRRRGQQSWFNRLPAAAAPPPSAPLHLKVNDRFCVQRECRKKNTSSKDVSAAAAATARAIIQGFSPYSPRVQEVRDGDRTTLLRMRCCHIVMPRRGKETQVRLGRYLTFPSDVFNDSSSFIFVSVPLSLNRRPQPHSIHYSRMFYVAGETKSCWGKKSLKVIDLAPPKVNLTLTRFEGPRGRVGEAGGRRARARGEKKCAGRGIHNNVMR